MSTAILAVVATVTVTVLYLFYGTPSRFQLQRVFKIASFLEASIEHAVSERVIDSHGNLDVMARNNWFLTYQGFFQEDVERIAKAMAKKKGFRRGFVEFGPGFTTFRFKHLSH